MKSALVLFFALLAFVAAQSKENKLVLSDKPHLQGQRWTHEVANDECVNLEALHQERIQSVEILSGCIKFYHGLNCTDDGMSAMMRYYPLFVNRFDEYLMHKVNSISGCDYKKKA